MIEINKEAEEYAWKKKNPFSVPLPANELVLASKRDFIAGHNSKATQSKIIQAQIDMLNSLDSKLQSKIESLIYMASEKNSDTEYFTIKIPGIKLIKEEIRRDLKELQQQLKQILEEITEK